MNDKYKILNGQDYFYKGLNNKKYIINICKTKFKIKKMIYLINLFIKNKDKKKYFGIDFEFNKVNNKREIALCQLNLEDDSKNANIFLFYPPDLSKDQNDIFIKLLIDQTIIKILHGGESLDIPYLFDNILLTEKNQELFCLSLVDSRYLCEYYHFENNIDETKCKINYLLVELKVISRKQFDFLQSEEDKMGPIYEIVIDVNKLEDLVLLYTLTDVLYLPELIKKFPDNIIYSKIVPQMTSFSFNIKRINDYNDFIQNISKYNINFLRHDEGLIQLNRIFNMVYNMIDRENKVYYILIEINYFKKIIEIMIKYFLYNYLIKNFYIWKNNTETISNKIDLDFSFLENYSELYDFFYSLKKDIKELLDE